jgi:hypothetical protein
MEIDKLKIPKSTVWDSRYPVFSARWPMPAKMALKPITDEIKVHDTAFSPIAKRNIALSILEKIDAFEKVWKKGSISPIPAEMVELRTAAQKQSATASVSNHKYDYACCVAYKVGTGKFDVNQFKAEWDSTNLKYVYNNLVEYSGLTNDEADSSLRITRMKNAILKAYQQYYADARNDQIDAKTLKIFMAPEFFFRGLKGAYDISQVSKIFTMLRDFTKDGKFKDWLFVFGTVIAASYADELLCRTCGTQGAKHFQRMGVNDFRCKTAGCVAGSVFDWRSGARIDNVALIQKGGESTDTNSFIVEKEFVSHVDFRRFSSPEALNKGKLQTGYDRVAIMDDWDVDRNIVLKGKTEFALPPTGSRDLYGGGSKFSNERMGGSIFVIDGIKVGLEICLDHLNARIPAGSGIQIQLVPSAGAFLQQFACVANGIAFNVDGGGTGTADVRINNAGGSAPENSGTLTSKSGAVTGGGEVVVYDVQPIPW